MRHLSILRSGTLSAPTSVSDLNLDGLPVCAYKTASQERIEATAGKWLAVVLMNLRSVLRNVPNLSPNRCTLNSSELTYHNHGFLGIPTTSTAARFRCGKESAFDLSFRAAASPCTQHRLLERRGRINVEEREMLRGSYRVFIMLGLEIVSDVGTCSWPMHHCRTKSHAC